MGHISTVNFFSTELQTHPAVAASEDVINPRTYAFGKYDVSCLEMTLVDMLKRANKGSAKNRLSPLMRSLTEKYLYNIIFSYILL